MLKNALYKMQIVCRNWGQVLFSDLIEVHPGREVMFTFGSLSKDLEEILEVGMDVLFEVKTIRGLEDKPIEQAINIRQRRKKGVPKAPSKD